MIKTVLLLLKADKLGALYLGLAGFRAVMCHQLHAELPRAY